ncbi:ATP-binding protein [Vibrio satsumensis]|uniref:AAA family ATPase n=1 Tax=Vibrio satsumensis TaxID=2910245 RepID=UPI003D0E35AB
MNISSFEVNKKLIHFLGQSNYSSKNKYSVFLGENGSGKSELIRELISSILRMKVKYISSNFEGKHGYSDPLDNYLSNSYKEERNERSTTTELKLSLENNNNINLKFSRVNEERKIKNHKGEYTTVTEDEFLYKSHLSTNSHPDDIYWLQEQIKSASVIAISESNHIKFPIIQDESLLNYFYPGWLQESTKESYFGYRAIKEVPFKQKSILLSILKSSDPDNRAKLRLIFELLKLDYRVKIDTTLADELLNDESRLTEHLSRNNRKFSSIGVRNKIEKEKIRDIKRSLAWYKANSEVVVSNVFSSRSTKLSRGFNLDLKNETDKVNHLYRLIENNLISVSKLCFLKNQNVIPFNEMSSGQICLLSSFSSISANIKNNSLIFIDEPELSLHPSWASKYIELLQTIFSKFNDCHFIIATHSPHIVSRLPNDDAWVIIMKDDGYTKCIESKKFNFKSIDFQLAEIFDFPGDKNEYLVRMLMILISKISNNDKLSNDDYNTISRLEGYLSKLKSDDPVNHLIKQVSTLVKHG